MRGFGDKTDIREFCNSSFVYFKGKLYFRIYYVHRKSCSILPSSKYISQMESPRGCSAWGLNHVMGKNEVHVFYILEPILTIVFTSQKVLIHWGLLNRNRLI